MAPFALLFNLNLQGISSVCHKPIVIEIPKVTIGTKSILKVLGCSVCQEPCSHPLDNFTSSKF